MCVFRCRPQPTGRLLASAVEARFRVRRAIRERAAAGDALTLVGAETVHRTVLEAFTGRVEGGAGRGAEFVDAGLARATVDVTAAIVLYAFAALGARTVADE